MSVSTLANLFITYLGGFFPAIETGLPRFLALGVLGAALTDIVLAGIRQSAQASNLLIVLKVGFVVAFTAAGVGFVQGDHLTPKQPLPDTFTFAQALLIYMFAYSGFERGSVVAGEARDPQRDVPFALVGGVFAVTFVYAAVLLVCVGVLDQPAANDRPLAEVGRQLFGHAGAVAVSAGAVAVIVGTILVITISMPRMLLALSEQDQLPAWLGHVHPKWRTPHVAIVISSLLGFGFAMAADLITALTMATAARLTGYILCCIALWRMSRRTDAPSPRFALPFRGPIALFTAALFTAVLALGAAKELWGLGVVLAIGLVLWMLSRRAPSPGPRNSP